jgi:hypothetical protein
VGGGVIFDVEDGVVDILGDVVLDVGVGFNSSGPKSGLSSINWSNVILDVKDDFNSTGSKSGLSSINVDFIFASNFS